MPAVAVVAHAGKSLGGGLGEFRGVLAREGVTDPLWYEVTKSRKAPKRARRALAQGAEVIFVWGGDGTVQRCIDAVAGTDAVLAILPAGTANLLAANLAGLVTAGNPVEWARALARVARGRAAESPFITVTRGKRFRIRLDHPLPCELDGGARSEVAKMRIKVHPGSVKICVPN